MKPIPIFYISDISKEKFPYDEYLNVETDGFYLYKNERKFFKALPKNLFPFTIEYKEAENRGNINKTLNNYSKSYENFYFWIENESLILKLYKVDTSELISYTEKNLDGTIIKKLKIAPSNNNNTNFDDLLNHFFNISNKENFIKIYNRHIRSYCDKFKINDNLFPIPFHKIAEISNLNPKRYNIDNIIKTLLESTTSDNNNKNTIENSTEFYEKFIIEENSELNKDLIVNIINENINKFKAYKSGQNGLANLFFGLYLKSIKNSNDNPENLNKEKLSAELKTFIDNFELNNN